MLLSALKAYEASLPSIERTPAFYAAQLVRYIVDLNQAGRFLGIVDTATTTKGRGARGIELAAPVLPVARTVKIIANLLMDNGEYALGVARPTSTPGQVLQRHAAFVETVRQCAEATGVPSVRSVAEFVAILPKISVQLPDGFDPFANVTFRVDGQYPMLQSEVQSYWARVHDAEDVAEADRSEGAPIMPCLLCGELRPILSRMPLNFKGIPGGQTSGCALISANTDAFESYGLKNSQIAPLCQACAEGAHKGLRALMQGESTHLRRDPLLHVFWTRNGEFSTLSFLNNPQPQDVKELLRTVDTARTGSIHSLGAERFYAASLSGSGGRVAVRDWLETSVAEAKVNLARFFRLQAIVDLYHMPEIRHVPVWRLAEATSFAQAREKRVSAAVARALYRFALGGGPVPSDVLSMVVRRMRSDHLVTPDRAALIKLSLLSQEDTTWMEEQFVSLESDVKEEAYLCGRLLAVLEEAQRQALGDIGATIVDRFYGAASSTPVAVFARLVRGAQPHLAKLRRDKPGWHNRLQRELAEIHAGLATQRDRLGKPVAAYPSTLSLARQGLFSLGYYHQRAEYFRPRSADGRPVAGLSESVS